MQVARGPIGALQHVPVDEPRRREQRRHAGRDAGWKLDVRDSLEHTLAREVIVGPVHERERDVREPIERDRAHDPQARQPIHLQLDRRRDQPLHLFGRMTGPLRDDLHHRRREIGVRVYRQSLERPEPDHGDRQRADRDEQPLPQRHGDDAVDERRPAGRLFGRRVCDLVRPGIPLLLLLAHWVCANCTNSAPSEMIRSPALSPAVTS